MVAIVRSDGSLAKGAKQRALLDEEGVPFKGEKVDMRAGPDTVTARCGFNERSRCAPGRAAFT